MCDNLNFMLWQQVMKAYIDIAFSSVEEIKKKKTFEFDLQVLNKVEYKKAINTLRFTI